MIPEHQVRQSDVNYAREVKMQAEEFAQAKTDTIAEFLRGGILTIPDLQRAMEQGTLTSEKLVQMYLRRIEAYDDKGPELNALITVNARALGGSSAGTCAARETPTHFIDSAGIQISMRRCAWRCSRLSPG